MMTDTGTTTALTQGREIKIQAWDSKGDMGMCEDFLGFCFQMQRENLGDPWNDPRFIKREYTGLKDRNGVDIYCGDIVSSINPPIEDLIHVVEWSEKYHGWFFRNARETESNKGGSVQSFVYWRNSFDIKIIGNIHANPELLPPSG